MDITIGKTILHECVARAAAIVDGKPTQPILGSVRVYRPEGRDRLSDWSRHGEQFRYIESSDATFIVNVAHIVEAREVFER